MPKKQKVLKPPTREKHGTKHEPYCTKLTWLGSVVLGISIFALLFSDPTKLLEIQPNADITTSQVVETIVATGVVTPEPQGEFSKLSRIVQNAYAAETQGRTYTAIEQYEKIISNQETLSEGDHRFVFNALGKLYLASHSYENAIRVFKTGISTRRDDTPANTWYGYWLQALIAENQAEEVRYIGHACLEELKDSSFFPFYCYHQLAMNEIFEGNKKTAENFFRSVYSQMTSSWTKNNGKHCKGLFVPLNLYSNDEETVKIAENTIINSDLTVGILDQLSTIPKCSEQKWPLYMINSTSTSSYTGHKFYEMGCYSNTEKTAVLNVLHDVFVRGNFKTISQETSENKCLIYTPGYMYINIGALPMPISFEELQLPIKKLENVLILHPMASNYFHTTIESISKVILALHHADLKITNLRILHPQNSLTTQYFDLLGISAMLEPYEPNLFRYEIKNLYSIDWHIDTEHGESFESTEVHFKDLFVPPAPIVHLMRSVLSYSIPKVSEPRNLVIFLHRESGHRTIAETKELYEYINFIAVSRGLEFYVHGISDSESIVDQIKLFSRAVVVIGIHGAGFTNIIHCKEGTHIIEIPVFPQMVSVYSRISSILNLKYYTLPNLLVPHYKSLETISHSAMFDIDNTLQFALQSSGFDRIHLQDTKMMLSAAKRYASMNLDSQTITILEEIFELPDVPVSVLKESFPLALSIYHRYNLQLDVTRLAQRAIEEVPETQYLSHWYGYWIGSLFQLGELEKFKNATKQCISRFQTIPNVEPLDCYIHMAKVYTFEENLKPALDLMLRRYNALLTSWRDDYLLHCPSILIPLTIEDMHSSLKSAMIIDDKILDGIPKGTPCSTQQWPLVLSQTGEHLLPEKRTYDKMKCFSEEEQKTVLYRIKDVYVRDVYQSVFHREGRKCFNFVSEFPFTVGVTFPRQFSQSEGQKHIEKPIKEFENVLLFHYMPESYHHVVAIGLPKLILALNNPELQKIPDLKILVRVNDVVAEYFHLLGVTDMVENYEPHLYRYHVSNLYSIEWMFIGDINQLLVEKQVYFDDFYVPPAPLLQFTSSRMKELIPAVSLQPRNVIVVLHRLNDKRYLNPMHMLQMIGYVAQLYGLELKYQGAFPEGESVQEKMELFHRAVAVVGARGDGLANMIFCQEGTAIIEFPTFPPRVSVYSRMASILNFPFYSVTSAKFSQYGDIDMSVDAIYSLEHTLYDALDSLNIKRTKTK